MRGGEPWFLSAIATLLRISAWACSTGWNPVFPSFELWRCEGRQPRLLNDSYDKVLFGVARKRLGLDSSGEEVGKIAHAKKKTPPNFLYYHRASYGVLISFSAQNRAR